MYLSDLRKGWLFRVILIVLGILLYFVVGGIFRPYTTAAFESGQLSNILAGVTGLTVSFMGFPLIVIAALPEHPRDTLWELQDCAVGRWLCGIMLVIVPGQFAWYLLREAYLPRCTGGSPFSFGYCFPVFSVMFVSALYALITLGNILRAAFARELPESRKPTT